MLTVKMKRRKNEEQKEMSDRERGRKRGTAEKGKGEKMDWPGTRNEE